MALLKASKLENLPTFMRTNTMDLDYGRKTKPQRSRRQIN